jgi:hypothetical protein
MPCPPGNVTRAGETVPAAMQAPVPIEPGRFANRPYPHTPAMGCWQYWHLPLWR